jgi:RES domain-containing protein
MKIYRIAGKKHINDLTGTGAKITGGRWNPKGLPVIYTAANSSLAILETLVHTDIDLIPDDLYIAEIIIEAKFTKYKIDINDLPKNWDIHPGPDSLKEIGKLWLTKNEFLVFQVPSAVNPLEYNYLINPVHKEFSKVRITKIFPAGIDKRLRTKRK